MINRKTALYRAYIFVYENPYFQIIPPTLTGIYYTAMEVYEKSAFFSMHPIAHYCVIGVLLTITFLNAILKTRYEVQENAYKSKQVAYLEGMTLLAEQAVKNKTNRFLKEANNFHPEKRKEDTFKKLADPEDQINLIIERAADLFRNCFGLDEEQYHFTILRHKHGTTQWHVLTTSMTQSEKTTMTGRFIMEKDKAAANATMTGEPKLVTSKKQSAKTGEYNPYWKDAQPINGNEGTAYYYPFQLQIGSSLVDKYLIIFSCYGKVLADPKHGQECTILRDTLRQICRRLKLELSLLTVAKWKYGE